MLESEIGLECIDRLGIGKGVGRRDFEEGYICSFVHGYDNPTIEILHSITIIVCLKSKRSCRFERFRIGHIRKNNTNS